MSQHPGIGRLRPLAVALAVWALVSAFAPLPNVPAARQWIEVRTVDLHLNDRITLRVDYTIDTSWHTGEDTLIARCGRQPRDATSQ